MGSNSKVFAFLLPPWGIDFTLAPNWDGERRRMGRYESADDLQLGRLLHPRLRGTDNPQHVKDIILSLTADQDNLIKISKDYQDFTNTVSGMEEAAGDDSFASSFLGGQNAYAYYAPWQKTSRLHRCPRTTRAASN